MPGLPIESPHSCTQYKLGAMFRFQRKYKLDSNWKVIFIYQTKYVPFCSINVWDFFVMSLLHQFRALHFQSEKLNQLRLSILYGILHKRILQKSNIIIRRWMSPPSCPIQQSFLSFSLSYLSSSSILNFLVKMPLKNIYLNNLTSS